MGSLRKRRAVIFPLIIIICSIILLSPVGDILRSYLIMSGYSYINYRDSVLFKNNIKFTIPGGIQTGNKDWYPFVITFNDDEGLSKFIGEDVEFTVLYNFGHFDMMKGSSVYYDPKSKYFSSFYGGYIVKPLSGRAFGFREDGTINPDELSMVPEFDQTRLVLSSLGCPSSKRVFESNIISINYDIQYIVEYGWTSIDSQIVTNSPVHQYKQHQMGYIQYGKPMKMHSDQEDFSIISLKGRAYVKYYEEYKATFVLYIMAPDWEVIDRYDDSILSKSYIGQK